MLGNDINDIGERYKRYWGTFELGMVGDESELGEESELNIDAMIVLCGI